MKPSLVLIRTLIVEYNDFALSFQNYMNCEQKRLVPNAPIVCHACFETMLLLDASSSNILPHCEVKAKAEASVSSSTLRVTVAPHTSREVFPWQFYKNVFFFFFNLLKNLTS